MIMSSSKVTDIHAQHHVLAGKVHTVCTILRNPSEIDDLKDEFDELVGYLQAHNEGEEKLMKSYNYHRLELHEREHQNLLSRLFSLREKVYVSVEEEHKQELLGFLETELTEHINEDLKLGLFPITTMPGGVE
jgi:hemerythrin-like metal-binding protein